MICILWHWILRLHSPSVDIWSTKKKCLKSPHFSCHCILPQFSQGIQKWSQRLHQPVTHPTPHCSSYYWALKNNAHSHWLWEDIGMSFSSSSHTRSTKPGPNNTRHAHKVVMSERLCLYSVSSFLQPAILATCPTPMEPEPLQSLCSQLLCQAPSSCCTSSFWLFLLFLFQWELK